MIRPSFSNTRCLFICLPVQLPELSVGSKYRKNFTSSSRSRSPLQPYLAVASSCCRQVLGFCFDAPRSSHFSALRDVSLNAPRAASVAVSVSRSFSVKSRADGVVSPAIPWLVWTFLRFLPAPCQISFDHSTTSDGPILSLHLSSPIHLCPRRSISTC